jgi:hypothetical protein
MDVCLETLTTPFSLTLVIFHINKSVLSPLSLFVNCRFSIPYQTWTIQLFRNHRSGNFPVEKGIATNSIGEHVRAHLVISIVFSPNIGTICVKCQWPVRVKWMKERSI